MSNSPEKQPPYLCERYELRHGKLCFRGTLIPVRKVMGIQCFGPVSEREAAAFNKKVSPAMRRMSLEDHNYLQSVNWLKAKEGGGDTESA